MRLSKANEIRSKLLSFIDKETKTHIPIPLLQSSKSIILNEQCEVCFIESHTYIHSKEKIQSSASSQTKCESSTISAPDTSNSSPLSNGLRMIKYLNTSQEKDIEKLLHYRYLKAYLQSIKSKKPIIGFARITPKKYNTVKGSITQKVPEKRRSAYIIC